LIRDATDRDLLSLYKKSHAVIIASYAEGFGLPIVEAMHAGTNVFCSDIPIFREIAGDYAVYFDPFSPESLELNVMNSLNNIVIDPNANNQSKKSWISWDQSTRQLLTKIVGLSKN
jgi:alpha-1,2-rhamnosyltransferase